MDAVGIQSAIAAGLQRLRKERALTQGELATALGLSQAQLSKIENGRGSLTAEQFVRLLQQYSLALSFFVGTEKSTVKTSEDENPDLQNALARLGATHLRTVPGVAVPEKFESPETVIVETLLGGSSRLITTLAPVIARHCDKINFQRIAHRMSSYAFGTQYRIWWLVDGTSTSIRKRLNDPSLSRDLERFYQRAFVFLERKKLDVGIAEKELKDQEDELDRDLISERTLQLVKKSRDYSAQHWHIVTRIKTSDFEQALRDAEEKGHRYF